MTDVSTQTDSFASFVAVRAGDETSSNNDESAVELPLEKDNSLAITTLQLQFPSAAGLKYKNPETGLMRILRCEDGRIIPPAEGWGSGQYIALITKAAATPIKRPANSSTDNGPPAKVALLSNNNIAKPAPTNSTMSVAKGPPSFTPANQFLVGGTVPVYTNTPVAGSSTIPGKPGLGAQSACKICNVTMNSLSQMQHHYEGKRHKDMVMMAQRGRGVGMHGRGAGLLIRAPMIRGLPLARGARPAGMMPVRPMGRGVGGTGRPLLAMRGGTRGVPQMTPQMRPGFRPTPPVTSFANDDWLNSGFNDFSGPQPW